ncbi:hypothetical protein ACFU44_00780 [Nocardia rhizosphaerihabitans]|uniref:hypothetical protein n=1 Tax=Nocardia rhizosphaerihabitans TaxID=1691570 RepID=UPI003670F73A
MSKTTAAANHINQVRRALKMRESSNVAERAALVTMAYLVPVGSCKRTLKGAARINALTAALEYQKGGFDNDGRIDAAVEWFKEYEPSTFDAASYLAA